LKNKFGTALGVDASSLKTDEFPIRVDVHIPNTTSITPQQAPDGTWHLQYGSVTELKATGSGTNVKAVTYGSIALALVLIAIVFAIVWRNYKPRHAEGGLSAADFIAQMKDEDEDNHE
jgi:hypothetical protein